jgi:hypothetical protein
MKNILFFFLFILLLISCKKEEDSQDLLIRLGAEINQTYGTREYHYYPDNNIKHYNGYFGEKNADYYYENDKITVIESDSTGIVDTIYMFLNEKGLVEKSYCKPLSQYGVPTFTYVKTYVYDNNGFLIDEYDTTNYFDKYFVLERYHSDIKDGNIIKFTKTRSSTDEDEIVKYYIEYTFYNGKINSLTNENKGMSFFGKSNKNPIQLNTLIYGNNPSSAFTYVYTYDSLNRISERYISEAIIDNMFSKFIYN